MNTLTTIAHHATSPDASRAAELVQRHIGAPNVAVWAGVMSGNPQGAWNSAAHILLMGVRGTPLPSTPARGQVRPDNPWYYIAESVGSRRREPIPVTANDALVMVRVLNRVATAQYPAPDLLVLTGWKQLHAAVRKYQRTARGWEHRAVLEAITSRVARTYRLWDVRRAFLDDHTKLRVVA